MSQLTRAMVIASTVLAAFAQTYVATFYWPPQTIWIASASVIVLAIAGYRLRALALPAVLASIYFMPAFLYVTRGGETFVLDFLWQMPLLGLTLSGPGAERWSLPAKWQWPLVTWAMIVVGHLAAHLPARGGFQPRGAGSERFEHQRRRPVLPM